MCLLCEEVYECVMGNTESMESQLAVIRSRAAPVRLPMPDPAELEERFSIALVNAAHSQTHTHTSYKIYDYQCAMSTADE